MNTQHSMWRIEIKRGWKRALYIWLCPFIFLTPVLASSTDPSPNALAEKEQLGSSASPLNRPLSELLHRSITTEDGAPVGICTMVQTPDGFMWLATRHGLFRFDGVSFVQMYQGQLPASGALKLWVDKDGSLWVGSFVNGVSHIKGGVVVNYSGHGLPSGSVDAILRRPDGKLWISTILDVAYLDGDHWVSASKHYGVPLDHPENMSLDSDGTLWVTGNDKSFSLAAGANTFEVKPKEASASSNVGLPSSFGWTTDYVNDGDGMVDSSGALWLPRVGGFERFRHPAEGRARAEQSAEIVKGKDSLTDAFVAWIIEDRDGDMWVATQKGLDLYRRPRLSRVTFPYAVFSPGVAAGDHGDVWITNYWQNLSHVSASNQLTTGLSLSGSTVSPTSKLENGLSLAVRDRFGNIWFAGKDTFAELHDNHITHFVLPAPLQSAGTRYQSLAIDDKGAIWVAVSAAGLWRFSDGVWAPNGGCKDLPVEQGPLSLAFDPMRGLWLGYSGNRTFLIHNDRVQSFDSGQGLSVGDPLVISPSGPHIWFGGDEGISFLSGSRFHDLVGLGGQRFRNTTGIVETQSGELWINGASGIFRIPANEVKALEEDSTHQVTFEQFDAKDGLDGASISMRPSPSMIIGTDGRIWATTSSGVVWIDPNHIARNKNKPSPIIESISDNDHSYQPVGLVRLPKRTNAIRIDYTAPVLGIPERAQFRYRLLGFDSSWQTVRGRRQAFYTNLAPATYRFELQASNEDGVWSDEVAHVDFSITPTFWQTPWFTALWIAVIALSLVLLYLARIKRIELREWIRRNERERIARDMHDTILQSVQALILRVHTAAHCDGDADERRVQIDVAIHSAQEALIEGRDKVMQLRGQDDKSYRFVERLARLDTEIGMGEKPIYAVVVNGTPRLLRLDAAEELYQVAKELVTNAARHAQADRVEVLISYGRWKLTLRVSDDGRGVGQGLLTGGVRVGHFGLVGVRERIGNLGGYVAVSPGSEGGTSVDVSIPGARAYAAR